VNPGFISEDPRLFEADVTVERIQNGILRAVESLGRRGAVVAVSGGVDSGVVAALCARALGPQHVMCLRLPEENLSKDSSDLGRQLAEQLGTPSAEEPISSVLESLGFFEKQTDAIRQVFPDYEPTWRHKIVRSEPSGGMIVFSLVVQRPDGKHERRRIPAAAYRALLSATNMKQRVRKLIEYTWADRLHYAVAGTANFIEYDQGFFVKGGDGLADLKPVAHLYKSQVYALARHLELPPGIRDRAPTTETFSLPQSQEEFYFGYPLEQMDLLVWGELHDVAPERLAPQTDLAVDDVATAYWEIRRRRQATAYLHAPAVLLDPAGEG